MRNHRNWRFVFTIFYTWSFQVSPEQNHPYLKCQFPPKISIWPKSLLYKHYEKWLSPPHTHTHLPPSPITPGRGGGGGELWWVCILISVSILFILTLLVRWDGGVQLLYLNYYWYFLSFLKVVYYSICVNWALTLL